MMDWRTYQYERFLRARRSLYPGDVRSLALPEGDPAAWALGARPASPIPAEDPAYWLQAGLLFGLKSRPPARTGLFLDLAADAPAPLAVQADFYRDFYLAPWYAILQADAPGGAPQPWFEALRRAVAAPGNVLSDAPCRLAYPRLWAPCALILAGRNPARACSPPPAGAAPEGALRVFIDFSGESLPTAVDPGWDLCLSLGKGAPPLLERAWQGWAAGPSLHALLNLLDMRVHAHHLRQIEAFRAALPAPACRLSVIVSTFRRPQALTAALQSLCEQSIAPEAFEILVVNNDPADPGPREVVAAFHAGAFAGRQDRLRLLDCPLPGLSFARNAAIGEARGEVLCYLDDDAQARPDWLAQIALAFEQHPEAGVVGGPIHLVIPQPRPAALKPGLERFWGHLDAPSGSFTEVTDPAQFPWGGNWCIRRALMAQIGGFRLQYGRRRKDFSGGEETIAAALARRLGWAVGFAPAAEVDHLPERARFTTGYLLKTIQAQILSRYRMGRDLYLPPASGAARQVKGAGRFAGRVLALLRLPARERESRAIEYLGYLLGWARLFFEQAADGWARLTRRP